MSEKRQQGSGAGCAGKGRSSSFAVDLRPRVPVSGRRSGPADTLPRACLGEGENTLSVGVRKVPVSPGVSGPDNTVFTNNFKQ